MSRHPDAPDCSACRDTGLVPSPRWWDDEAELEPCMRPGCWAAEERAQQESDRSASQGPLRSDLAGFTPSPGGASDDAGVQFTTRRAS
jgi:hypothetical protein